MNRYQKLVLLLTGAAILLMLLFPPFQIIFSGTTINMGYGFLFTPPKRGYVIASVNSVMLFVQWIGVLAVGSLAFFLLKSTEKTSLKKEEKKTGVFEDAILDETIEDIFSNREVEEAKNDNTAESRPIEINMEQGSKFLGGANHPWRRFFARTMELFSFAMIAGVLLVSIAAMLFPDKTEVVLKAVNNPIIAAVIVYTLWIPIEAAFLASAGTTPAKLLFGIRVLKKNGEKLSFSAALKRTIYVWVQGEGFGIPFVALITRYFAYRRLRDTGTTLWDDKVGTVVSHKEWGTLRFFICFIAVIAVLVIYSVIDNI